MTQRKHPVFMIVSIFWICLSLIPSFSVNASASQSAEYAIVIVIDGCRPEYFKLATLPHIQELANRGVTYQQAWVGQIPNNTPPVHATLGTGVFPARHHVVGFNWKDPETGKSFYPRSLENIRHGAFAKIIADAQVPSVFELYKKTYPWEHTLAISSVKPYAAIPLGNFGADYILFTVTNRKEDIGMGEEHIEKGEISLFEALSGHEVEKSLLNQINHTIRPYEQLGDYDTWVVEAFLTVFKAKKPRLTMINLPEIDITGHKWGGLSSPEAIRPVIENVDLQVGRIIEAFKAAKIFEKTLFVITSDHGMVTNAYNVSVGSYIPAFLALKSLPQLGITTPFIWLRDSKKSGEVAKKIEETERFGINRVFYKSPINNGWVYQPASKDEKSSLEETYHYLLKTMACPNSPDIFLFIKENVIFGKKFPVNTRGKHYGTTWFAQHIPLIISGPGVKQNYQSDMPARIVDIPPTVLTLMGIIPQDMDGTILADAFVNPNPEHARAQREIRVKLGQYQHALIYQSKEDIKNMSVNSVNKVSVLSSLWFYNFLISAVFILLWIAIKKWKILGRAKKYIVFSIMILFISFQTLFFWFMLKIMEL